MKAATEQSGGGELEALEKALAVEKVKRKQAEEELYALRKQLYDTEDELIDVKQ